MPLPSGFAPSLSLGGGPSQAINNAAPVVSMTSSGAFNVGAGSATQSNAIPALHNSTGNGQSPGSPYTTAGIFSSNTLYMLLMGLAVLYYIKKKA